MKNIRLVLIFLLSVSINLAYSQCEVDPGCEDPEGDGEVCPEILPDAIEATPYSESATILCAQELEGALVHHMELVEVLNIPPGMDYTCQDDVCTFYPAEPRCILLFGTPDVGAYGTYELTIIVEVFVDVFGMPVSIGEQEEIMEVVILPKVSSDFDIASPICQNETYMITYTGNATAAAEYTWDFDDALVLSGSGQGPYEVKWEELGEQTISLLVFEDDFWSPFNEHNFEVLNCTGVDDYFESTFRIYPNPSNNFINYEVLSEFVASEVQIYDMCGRLCLSKTLDESGKGRIDVSGLTYGCYIVKCGDIKERLVKL
jgi:hypothetical protein